MTPSLTPHIEATPVPRSPHDLAPRSAAPGFLARLAQGLTTLLVLAALGGLGYWGHKTGWKLPRFSALIGNGQMGKEDWCEAHGVPESVCVECNAGLLPKSEFGWCAKHGVHDCPFEHPEVAQLKETPVMTPADLERAERALSFLDRPENNSRCKLHQRRIQFASPEAVDKAGIDVAAVKQAPVSEWVSANGEISYDQTRVASLSTPVPGKVWRVEKELGQPVSKGEVLALVEAAEVGKAKEEFLKALAEVDLQKKNVEAVESLSSRGGAREVEVRQTQTALRVAQIRLGAAEQALVNLGLPIRSADVGKLTPEELARRVQFLGLAGSITQVLDAKTMTANLLPVRAPLDGVVVSRKPAVVGEIVDASKTLFVIADTRLMWLTLHVRFEDANSLKVGQAVRFRPDGGGEQAAGKVSWISTAADEKTRTVEVRALLPNPAGRLRANTFGAGRIILREEPKAIVVPSEAVQREGEGDCHIVFVRDKNYFTERSPKVFHVRTVRVGARDEQRKLTEIVAGLLPREVVVTKGSGMLRAELLKNNLGEG